MATKQPAGTPETDLAQALWDLLSSAGEPQTASQLSGRLKEVPRPLVRQVPAILEGQVAAGRLTRFAPFRGKAPRYWTRDHATYARSLIEQALANGPRTSSDLEKAIAKRLGDFTKPQRQAVLDQMVAEGKVYRLPNLPGSRSTRYSLLAARPAGLPEDPGEPAPAQLDRLAKELARFGVAPRTRSPRPWSCLV